MSRFVFAITLAVLATVCLARPVSKFESLSNPVLVALEDNIKQSTETVQPPEFKSDLTDELQRDIAHDSYDRHISMYKSGDLYSKIKWLSADHVEEFKALIVEDVLKNMKEDKKTIVEACNGLASEAKSALAEVNALPVGWQRTDFLNRDDNVFRAHILVEFCKFL